MLSSVMLALATTRAPRALLALVTTGALVLAACSSAPPAPTAAPAKPAEAKPTDAPKPTAPAAASPAASPATAASPAAASASPAAASASPAAASAAASPAASSAASPAASPAAAAGPQVVNGEIDSVDGRVMTVATATGVRKVRAADNATILIEGKGTVEDLKSGAYVGITGKPDGTAVIVRLFPPGIVPKPSQFPMGGPQAGNVMTNAAIVSFDGKSLVVDLGGEKATIAVPPEAEIVKPVPSNFSEIKPGTRVAALGQPEGDQLVAQTITIITQPAPVRAG
jgi:hypothetical protein